MIPLLSRYSNLDLEERERKAAETRATVVGAGTEARTAEEEFAKQLERLRRENARLLERERELFEQELSSSHKNGTCIVITFHKR